mmetsp:Transcript_11661/g.17712  ORF Transcript_11661/g.17712 Transcript_11661/m.17712 type:complete len:126 (-) Transcript_11661:1024-1401(-)
MLCSLRPLAFAFIYDPLDIRGAYSDDTWYIAVQIQDLSAILFFSYHLHNFDHSQRGHTTFGIIYFNLICFAVYSSVYGFSLSEMDQLASTLLFFTVLTLPLVLVLVRSETAHMEHVQKMLKNISD